MITVLTGWFLVGGVLAGSPKNTYVFVEPKKNIELLVESEKQFTENTWVLVQSLATCQKTWDDFDRHWSTFCIAREFEDKACPIGGGFMINGVTYC